MTVLQEVDGFMAVDPAQSPARQVETREMVTDVLGALNQLTPNQQEVIRLKFQAGLSYREIGQITGLSTSNVGFQIHTGIKKLRQKIASSEDRSPAIRRVK